MKRKNKIILCIGLFALGLLSFILQVFVFEAPDGILGFLLCLISIYLMLGSVIKLCKLSKRFSSSLIAALDLLFWIP